MINIVGANSFALRMPTMPTTHTLSHAFGEPTATGKIRSTPEDFQVDELLGFELSGEGEHACLLIRKRNTNTAFVAEQLAKLAGIKPMDVSYAGLKDRHAVTTQWFSLYLSNKPEPDWTKLNSDEIEVLQVTRHNRKLRRGALQGNRFKLILRELQGDITTLEPRLQQIATQGVPNYFGEQRFGFENLDKVTAMFEGRIKVHDRNKRSMYLSSARSAIFNHLLSQRVADGSWNSGLPGDMMMLDGSHSVFLAEEIDATLTQRLQEQDIHPSGPMWGKGDLPSRGEVQILEQQLRELYPLFCNGLEQADMKQERRALRLPVSELQWRMSDDTLTLSFFLTAGSYATVVLRELIDYHEAGKS
jgi:tRNA pseudouridine13 synthase